MSDEMPRAVAALLGCAARVLFPIFFPTHLQLTLPADEMEHFLPAPALITSCIPGEIMSLSLCSEPPCPSKAEGAEGGQAGFTWVTPIKTNVSSLSAGARLGGAGWE